MFFGPSGFQLRSKIDKKVTPDRSKIEQKFGQHLDPISDASWRPTWLPRPSQNPPKIDQKSMKNRPKNHSYFLNPSWSQCGTTLVQLLGHLVPTWPNLVPTWFQLGPNMAPKPPLVQGMRTHFSVQNAIKFFWNSPNPTKSLPNPPKSLLDPTKNWFSMIFGWFLIDFWLIFLRCCSFFDQMLMDFWLSFCSCSVHVLLCCCCFGLLACCFVGLLTHRTSTEEHTNSPNFHKWTHQLT